MTEANFKELRTGDIVRPVGGVESYIITINFGDRATAVRVADLTNPREWDLVYKATHVLQPPN